MFNLNTYKGNVMGNIKVLTEQKSQRMGAEFMRYLLVGGSAFFVDMGILFLMYKFLFHNTGELGILIGTALGFAGGLIYSYLLSIIFVFNNAVETVKGKTGKIFILFALIGIIGLILTEWGMYMGIKLFDTDYYLIVKCFVSGVVLLWNYGARKFFIFK